MNKLQSEMSSTSSDVDPQSRHVLRKPCINQASDSFSSLEYTLGTVLITYQFFCECLCLPRSHKKGLRDALHGRNNNILLPIVKTFRLPDACREPEAESAVAEPVPPSGGTKSHERGLDFGHVPELQHDDGHDGNEQLPVGIHDAQLFQSAGRSGGQRGRVVDVELRSFAGQRVAHAVPLLQRDPGERLSYGQTTCAFASINRTTVTTLTRSGRLAKCQVLP